jgi:hypothetical protein
MGTIFFFIWKEFGLQGVERLFLALWMIGDSQKSSRCRPLTLMDCLRLGVASGVTSLCAITERLD